MSAFGDDDKDNLEFWIRTFLKDHTIADLLDVVRYCVEDKESEYIDENE